MLEVLALAGLVFVMVKAKTMEGRIGRDLRTKQRYDKYPFNTHIHLNNARGFQGRGVDVTGQNAVTPDMSKHLNLGRATYGNNRGQKTAEIWSDMTNRMVQAEDNVSKFKDQVFTARDLEVGQTIFIPGDQVRVRLPYDFDAAALGGNRYVIRG